MFRSKPYVLLSAFFGVIVSMLPSALADTSYQVISQNTQFVNGLDVSETVVQEGSDPRNRFTMHRVVRHGMPAHAAKAVLMLMPGGSNNFDLYEADENGRYKKSLVGFLASRGIDVWGYSPRTKGIAAGSCESGAVDCSIMAQWGFQTVVEDATFIRSRIASVHGSRKPVLGGWSLGALTATATLNSAPADYAGFILWEGTLYSTDVSVNAINQQICDNVTAQLASGATYDAQSFAALQIIYQLQLTDPNGPTPLPGFPPGFTNRQVYVAVFTSPNPAPVPNYTFLTGSLQQNGFTYTSEQRLGVTLPLANPYETLANLRDQACSLAGDQTFTDYLHEFTGPVLAIGAGKGFGPYMNDGVAVLGSTDITWEFEPDFSHGDHFLSADHRRYLDRPILQWLRRNHF